MVPPGGGGLSGKIKSRLSESGWKLSVFRGPEVTVGSVGTTTSVSTSDTFNTRYILAVDSNQFDICFNFQAAIHYDISLIDTKSGSEVVTMSGRGCEDDVATEFMKQLQ